MALVGLVLIIIVLLGFLGAGLSSRARLERKSIANFHEKMGQLSGVVQAEGSSSHDGDPLDQELFTEVPTHVRVVGKAKPSKGSSTSKRRVYQPSRKPTSPSGSPSKPGRQPSSLSRSRAVKKPEISEIPSVPSVPEQVKDPVVEKGPVGGDNSGVNENLGSKKESKKLSKVSSFSRGSLTKVRTEFLQFDDSGDSETPDSDGDLRGYERKVNTKVLAVASLALLVGIGAIIFSLSSSSSPASQNKVPPAPTKSSKTAGRQSSSVAAAPSTTVAPVVSNGPLSPTTSNSSGAVYYINASTLTLVIHASAPSWVEESVSPGSAVLWEGIIPAGGSKTLSLNSSMWIKTGNVDVLNMTLNGRKVNFTASPGVYDFTFNQGVKA